MIRRVRVQGFKRFADVTFELPGHIVVAGPNNCGKTTLLQAVASWAYALQQWRNKNDFGRHKGAYTRVPVARPNFYPVPVRSLELLWWQREYKKPFQIDVTLESGPRVAMEFEPDSTEQLYVRPLKDVDAEVLKAEPFGVSYIPAMTGLGTQEPRYQPPKIAQLLGQGKPGDVIRNLLVEASEHADAWQELTKAVRRLFGYEVLSPNAAGADIIAEYRSGEGGPVLDIASSGSGFQQVLLLLTFLHVRPGSVLLLDEPDAHLHVLLQDAIYSELRTIAARRNSRLLIATHSEVIINSVAAEELCMLLNQPRLLSSTADKQRLGEALGILTNLDLMLVEGAPGVLFTEDFTDLEILREWARVLKHPLYPALVKGVLWKKVSQQQHAGASGIAAKDYFDKLRLIREDLRGLELLDRGGNPKVPATEIPAPGLQRLRWDRYEIESYLFHPAALQRYVAEKVGPGSAALHVAELEKHLQSTMPPQYLQDPFANLPFLMGTKARTELLPPALTAAGLPGIPYTSYSEIAAIMLPEEIHPEVKQKLDLMQKAFNL